MPAMYKDGIKFDSELELMYYKELELKKLNKEIVCFVYHPKEPFVSLVGKRSYTPDFIVEYANGRIEIVETKGYNPYSKLIDDAIHQAMLNKSNSDLTVYAFNNGFTINTNTYVVYRKIKYLKAYGFVEWDFKNPNTQINHAREKISTQKDEIKELKEFKKNAERYFKYHLKIVYNEKLTKSQLEWYTSYCETLKANYMEVKQ